MKYLVLAVATMFASISYGQCDKPSKYEDSKYDYLYGWDTVSINENERLIIDKNREKLNRIHCELRKRNLTRAYLVHLPKDVQSLQCVKSFTIPHPTNNKPTVPVFKLLSKV